ncbi:MAG: hypothetical protein WAK86_02080, partial [Pseudonocardiaceae bacterium]
MRPLPSSIQLLANQRPSLDQLVELQPAPHTIAQPTHELQLAPGLAELIALYYRLVPPEELSTAVPAELVAAVQSHLALAADRVPGRALVRLLNPPHPTLAEHGWNSRDTVV